MDSVTVSPKFRVAIPQKVREMLGLKAGRKLRVLACGNQVVLIPLRPIREARGSLQGIDTDAERDADAPPSA